MEDLDKFSTDEQHPVLVTKEEKMYIREGRMEGALKYFKRPAYAESVQPVCVQVQRKGRRK